MDEDLMMRAMYGQFARHVPCWLWVQNMQPGVVIVAGASRMQPVVGVHPDHEQHPLRYGSEHTHQFILGELIVRPHLVLGTNVYRGHGINALLQSGALDVNELVEQSELICDPLGALRK